MKINLNIGHSKGISNIVIDLDDPDIEEIEHWHGLYGIVVKVKVLENKPTCAYFQEPNFCTHIEDVVEVK